MKKNSLLFLFIWCCFATSPILGQSVDWYDIAKGRSPDRLHTFLSTLQADEKYLYVTTNVKDFTFSWWTNFNVTFCKSGDTLGNLLPNLDIHPQAYLAQYTHEGRLRWAKPIGTKYATFSAYQMAHSVANKGFIYNIAPNMLSQDSSSSPAIGNMTCLTLSKFDENGNVIWQKHSNKTFYFLNNRPIAIATDADENIYVLFSSVGTRTVLFDSIVPNHHEKAVVYKFDKHGRALFGVSLPTEDIDCRDIKVDKKGNVFVLFTEGGRNWRPLGGLDNRNAFVLRIDSEGKNIKKIINFTSNSSMWCNRFDILPNGDFVLVGSNMGQMKIGTFKTEQNNQTNREKPAQFITRFSNQGELIWYKSYPFTAFSDITDITQEADGHLLVSGVSSHPNSVGYPNVTNPNVPKGRSRFFVKRLTPYGAMVVDSVELYTEFYEDLAVGDTRVSSVNGKVFAAFDYQNTVDTLGDCAAEYVHYPTTCVVRLSDHVLQKRKTPPLSKIANVFPNPTPDGRFFVKINEKSSKEKIIRIFNLQGMLVQEKNLGSDILESAINLSNEASGVYLVQISVGDEKFTYKIFKNL